MTTLKKLSMVKPIQSWFTHKADSGNIIRYQFVHTFRKIITKIRVDRLGKKHYVFNKPISTSVYLGGWNVNIKKSIFSILGRQSWQCKAEVVLLRKTSVSAMADPLTPTIYFTLTVKEESAASLIEIQNFYSANDVLTQESNRLRTHTESHSRWICSTAKWGFSHLLSTYLLNTIVSRQCSRH